MDKQRDVKRPAPDAASIIAPALKFGAMTGSAGLVVGGVAGVIRETPAIFFATASGIQWFGLGTTYWGTRSAVLQAWDTGKGITPNERVSASTIAGTVAGSGIGLLTRGPRNAIPGGLMFGIFGFAGQHIYNFAFDRTVPTTTSEEGQVQVKGKNLLERLAGKKWTPFTVLSDQEYKTMLDEKLLRLEAEIALVDDRIARLRIMETEWNATENARKAQEVMGEKKV